MSLSCLVLNNGLLVFVAVCSQIKKGFAPPEMFFKFTFSCAKCRAALDPLFGGNNRKRRRCMYPSASLSSLLYPLGSLGVGAGGALRVQGVWVGDKAETNSLCPEYMFFMNRVWRGRLNTYAGCGRSVSLVSYGACKHLRLLLT